MKLKANDTIHISAVQSDNLVAGQEFEVDDATAKKLIERGLATEAKGAKPKEEPKAPAKASKKKGK